MSQVERLVSRHADIPFVFNENFLAAAIGGGNDFEQPILAVPTLKTPSSGEVGAMPNHAIRIRSIEFVPSAAITGVATNNFTINFNWWRNGVKQAASPIATITFALGTNATQHAPINFFPSQAGATAGLEFILQPGDSLTCARVTNGTGLASPQFIVVVEYDAADPYNAI